MIKNKKLLLNLGLSIVVMLPLVSIISCGHSKSNNSKSSKSDTISESNTNIDKSDSELNSNSNESDSNLNSKINSDSDKLNSEFKSDSNESDSNLNSKINSDSDKLNSEFKSDSEETNLQKAINIVKKNLINKNAARWIKPSIAANKNFVNNSLWNQELSFLPYIIEGYKLGDIKLNNADDDKGTLNINCTLIKEINKETHTFSYLSNDFLTTEQEQKNKKLEPFLNELTINENKYFLSLYIKDDLNDKNIDKNKSLEELLKTKVDSILPKEKILNFLKNKTLKTTNSNPVFRNRLGIEIPYLEFDAYIEHNGIKSTEFSVIISGLEKNINEDIIKKLIDWGFLLKKYTAFVTLPSKVNKNNYTNYIYENLWELIPWSNAFKNEDKIKFEISDIKEQNDLNGSLKADIYVKSTDNSIKEFKYTSTLYGFKIKESNIINVSIDTTLTSKDYKIIIVGQDLSDNKSDYILKSETEDIEIDSIKKENISISTTLTISKNKLKGNKVLKLKIKDIEKEIIINIP